MSAKPWWASLTDDELLELRFCDLELTLDGSPLAARIERLYDEMARREIDFRPHCWLAAEWFSPDGVPGIAIPFYLAHPRLLKLEQRQMFEVEGGTERSCMKLLRHEAGHALDTAFQLHRRKLWRQHFGRYSDPYPEHYTPKPRSRRYVLHLDWWYAQCHPAEDFAETFAVWLRPRKRWREQYEGWPALKKLEAVDEMMYSIAGQRPLKNGRKQIESLVRNKTALGDYYAEKRAHYGTHVPEVYDGELTRLFTPAPPASRRRQSAAAFLKRHAAELCQLCARGTGEHTYVIAQLIQEMVVRCRELSLYLRGDEQETKTEIAIVVAVHMLNYLHQTHHRIPV